jgi:hypothetical protein
MNRKIYLLLTVLLAWSFNLKAQTAQIESVTANPGSAVSFSVDVAGLPANVGAVSLFIGYDPNVLTFTGSTPGDPEFAGYFINNMSATNQVGIQWTDPYGADINGTLLTLNFQYSALGGSCGLTFNAGCEFTDVDLNPVLLTYTNGSIGPNAGVATITIDELLATAGPVSLGVTGAGFDADAGAVTLYIAFDKDVLQFTSYTTTLTGLSLSVDNTTGLIGVAYSNYNGHTLNETFLTLNFNYDGTGPSELVFTGGCEIAYIDLTMPVVSFDNGLVEPLASAYSLTIGDVVTTPGGIIGVPVTAAGYDPILMGAVTLFIGYNPAHLSFVSITGGTISGASAYAAGPGLIGITWSDAGGALIDGTLLTLNFDYHFGSSEITFEGGCELTDNALTFIPTTYFDGSIAPVLGGPEISLPTQTGVISQAIDFPITAKNFLMDVGAISLFIGYDDNVLTYTGNTPGTLTGYFINNMVATSQIGIQWSDYNGLDIDPANDDVILTLHFTYNGGVAPLTFDAGCDFAQPDLTFIPVAYYDGAVITGTLFSIKAFLEGPFNGATMNAYLNDFGWLPLSQPYSAEPWFYAGTESVGAIPNANVVDWVLLEFRQSTGDASTATTDSIVARQAAFILADGSIVDLDGESPVLAPMAFSDNVYVVIWHRNHIRIMSADALTQVAGVYVYDFTDGLAKAYDSQQKDIGGGIFGMYASDIDSDGEVYVGDLSFLLNAYPTFNCGYDNSDVDLDGEVYAGDLNYLLLNYPVFTAIP